MRLAILVVIGIITVAWLAYMTLADCDHEIQADFETLKGKERQ